MKENVLLYDELMCNIGLRYHRKEYSEHRNHHKEYCSYIII